MFIAEVSSPEKVEEVDDGSGDAVGSVEDVAALASAAQPTGYTFATTNVHTKVGLSLFSRRWRQCLCTVPLPACLAAQILHTTKSESGLSLHGVVQNINVAQHSRSH